MDPLNLMKRLRNLLTLIRRNAPRELTVNRLSETTCRSLCLVGLHQVLDDSEQVGRVTIESNGDPSQDVFGDGLRIHHFLSNAATHAPGANEKPLK